MNSTNKLTYLGSWEHRANPAVGSFIIQPEVSTNGSRTKNGFAYARLESASNMF